jgi:hypothetical protein
MSVDMHRNLGRVAIVGAVLAMLSAGSILGYRANGNYQRYGVYTLSPGRDTPRLKLAGRDYARGQVVREIPAFYVALGTSPGGGTIYGYDTDGGLVPPTIVVAYPDGHLRQYALQGGP